MRIEKLNENQIRATLSRDDLEKRQITLTEFAYGTDSARQLFSELLRFAAAELDFDVDDSPIMVEAIPVSQESIVLLITKVPFPEELDTRFARFSDAPQEDFADYGDANYTPGEVRLHAKERKATDILDVTVEGEDSDKSDSKDATEVAAIPPERYTRLFRMNTIDEILAVSKVLNGYYYGENTLYHTNRGYEIVVHIGDHSVNEFNRVINILSEYGTLSGAADGMEGYLHEHAKPVVSKTALQTLAQV